MVQEGNGRVESSPGYWAASTAPLATRVEDLDRNVEGRFTGPSVVRDAPAADVLDNAERYGSLDPTGIRFRIGGLPEQCRQAWELARQWELPASMVRPRRVVVVGMGGSAIGAEIVAQVAARRSAVQVEVHRSSDGPITDADTLVIASSYSGETSEVLSAFTGTLGAPGGRLVITGGGSLASLARERNIPLLTFKHDGEPRSALGFGVFLLLGVLARLDALPMSDVEVEDAIVEMELQGRDWEPESSFGGNPAKQLAERLFGGIPVVFGEGFLQAAARRWQNQFNENSKQWAFAAALPELTHNLIEGFGRPTTQLVRPIVLEGASTDWESWRRTDLVVERLDFADAPCERIDVAASSDLGSLLLACHLGDWVSLYLALLNEVDPATVPAISWVKERLRGEVAVGHAS